MKLRSGKIIGCIFKIPLKKQYKVIIDFDNASREWRKNKIDLGKGIFQFKLLINQTYIQFVNW